MAKNVKRVVKLPDGTICEVGEVQYAAISELTQAISYVALGATENLSVVQSDGFGTTRQRLYSTTAEGAGLNEVADALSHQSKLARQMASAWDGNAPEGARSHLEH